MITQLRGLDEIVSRVCSAIVDAGTASATADRSADRKSLCDAIMHAGDAVATAIRSHAQAVRELAQATARPPVAKQRKQ